MREGWKWSPDQFIVVAFLSRLATVVVLCTTNSRQLLRLAERRLAWPPRVSSNTAHQLGKRADKRGDQRAYLLWAICLAPCRSGRRIRSFSRIAPFHSSPFLQHSPAFPVTAPSALDGVRSNYSVLRICSRGEELGAIRPHLGSGCVCGEGSC